MPARGLVVTADASWLLKLRSDASESNYYSSSLVMIGARLPVTSPLPSMAPLRRKVETFLLQSRSPVADAAKVAARGGARAGVVRHVEVRVGQRELQAYPNRVLILDRASGALAGRLAATLSAQLVGGDAGKLLGEGVAARVGVVGLVVGHRAGPHLVEVSDGLGGARALHVLREGGNHRAPAGPRTGSRASWRSCAT